MAENMQISVIVAVYNVKPYLFKCVESIIGQTYKNLDIILVDDGSTDGSSLVCDEFAEKDERITVIHQENKGLVEARKAGLGIAQGRYAAFVDGDDWIEPEMYQELLHRIIDCSADFVHSGWHEERNGQIINTRKCDCKTVYDETFDKAALLKEFLQSAALIDNTIWSKLYFKEFIKECYMNVPDDQSQGEDLLCFCECVLNSRRIAVQQKAYYHRIYREESLSHCEGISPLVDICKCYYYLGKTFSKHNCGKEFEILRNRMMMRDIIPRIDRLEDVGVEINYFYLDNIELIRDKRIVLFGAGKIGRDFYAQISKYSFCKICRNCRNR